MSSGIWSIFYFQKIITTEQRTACKVSHIVIHLLYEGIQKQMVQPLG